MVTVPVPVGDITVLTLLPFISTAPISVVVLFAARVVNAPVLLVVAPMLILLMVPAVFGLIVTVPVPNGVIEVETSNPLMFTIPSRVVVPTAVRDVNPPVALVLEPIGVF